MHTLLTHQHTHICFTHWWTHSCKNRFMQLSVHYRDTREQVRDLKPRTWTQTQRTSYALEGGLNILIGTCIQLKNTHTHTHTPTHAHTKREKKGRLKKETEPLVEANWQNDNIWFIFFIAAFVCGLCSVCISVCICVCLPRGLCKRCIWVHMSPLFWVTGLFN